MKKTVIALLAVASLFAASGSLNKSFAAKPAAPAAVAAQEGTRQVKTFGIIPKLIGAQWLKDDPRAVFTFISQQGYRQVERNDNYGMTAAECRKFLDSLKLETVIWGLAAGDVPAVAKGDMTGLDKSIALAKEAGAKYVACYSTTKEYGSTIEGWKEWAALLNKAGEYLAKHGLKLIYHNHHAEFEPIEGVVPYDVLVPALDPRFCNMELDVFWAIKGGADPVAVMNKYPGRITVLHLKDMSAGPEKTFADLGYGTIDYKPVFDAAPKAGVKFYIVEHDKPKDSKLAIEHGAEFFKTFKF